MHYVEDQRLHMIKYHNLVYNSIFFTTQQSCSRFLFNYINIIVDRVIQMLVLLCNKTYLSNLKKFSDQ